MGDLGHFEAAGISKLRFFERGLHKNGKVYGKNGGILGTAQLRSKNFRKTIFADFQVWCQKNPKMLKKNSLHTNENSCNFEMEALRTKKKKRNFILDPKYILKKFRKNPPTLSVQN